MKNDIPQVIFMHNSEYVLIKTKIIEGTMKKDMLKWMQHRMKIIEREIPRAQKGDSSCKNSKQWNLRI